MSSPVTEDPRTGPPGQATRPSERQPSTWVAFAGRLRTHADGLTRGGRSSLLVGLLRAAADDGGDEPFLADLLAENVAGVDSDPAPRLAAAIRYLALNGGAPDLARGLGEGESADPALVWSLARAAIADNLDEIRAFVARGPQSNDPGLSAVLYGALLLLAERYAMPVRLLEVGASAGLNLNADRYRYTVAGQTLGEPGSALGFRDPWDGGRVQPLPGSEPPLRISRRAGCDLHPIDSRTAEGKHRLLAYLWPDQLGPIARLESSWAVTPPPPKIVAAPAAGWLSRQLAERRDDELTVVWRSRLRAHMSRGDHERLESVLTAGGTESSIQRPLASLELEPSSESRGQLALVLRTWPLRERQLLAYSPPGRPSRQLAALPVKSPALRATFRDARVGVSGDEVSGWDASPGGDPGRTRRIAPIAAATAPPRSPGPRQQVAPPRSRPGR